MAVDVRLVNEICALGWVDRLQIAVWRENDIYTARVFYREMKAGISRFGSGLGHLAVIEPNTPLPPPEVRKIIIRVFEEHPTAVGAVSVAFEGQGFFASAVRSVATGIMMLANSRAAFRPCGNVADSANFVSRHLAASGAPINPGICIDAVEVLRRQMGQRRAQSA
ncbi:hypothetical protein WMF31_02075 [Sorangium sp. So ce1036]|uniref:hypothetical protein n=1 Tax=Sorangium sp. So ce1036 TaxID=3133328 RepID=UPI003F04B8D5